MPQATMQGVTLFTKTRKRHNDVFELALTYDGIEIRRPNESPRHLSWDRVSEWEIEQRRGAVVLTLRGGGSVTPLVIPNWKVDDLDVVLREVTSHSPPVSWPETGNGPSASRSHATDTVLESTTPPADIPAANTPAFTPAPTAPTAAQKVEDLVPEQLVLPPVAAVAEAPAPDIAPLAWPGEAPVEDIEGLSWPSAMTQAETSEAAATEFVLPEEPISAAAGSARFGPTESPTWLTPAPVQAPRAEPPPAAEAAPVADPVIEPLVTEEPVVDVLALVDDVLAEPAITVPPEVVRRPEAVAPVVKEPEVTETVTATLAATPAAPAPPIVIAPKEGMPEAPAVPRRADRRTQRRRLERERARSKVVAPAPAKPTVEPAKVQPPRVERPNVERPKVERPRVERPKVERPKVERVKAARQVSWRVATTVVLLGAVALAVALVLAQSAGMIHLPFFGNPA